MILKDCIGTIFFFKSIFFKKEMMGFKTKAGWSLKVLKKTTPPFASSANRGHFNRVTLRMKGFFTVKRSKLGMLDKSGWIVLDGQACLVKKDNRLLTQNLYFYKRLKRQP